MKLGYLYRVKADATQDGKPLKRFFCFEQETGRFIGLSGSGWPRFNHGNGKESCCNIANPDEILEEVED